MDKVVSFSWGCRMLDTDSVITEVLLKCGKAGHGIE